MKNAKPGRKSDGKGLYLLTKPSPDDPSKAASQSWVLRVMHNGVRTDYGLGGVADRPLDVDLPLHKRKSLTLAEAREKARIGREIAKAGLNPSSEWRREVEQETPIFEVVAKQYLKEVSASWRKGKHGAQWINTLRDYAFPLIGNLAVDQIDAAAIHKLLLRIWLEKPETARRVRQRIGVVLDYAHGKGWRDTEAPMRAVSQLLGGIKQPKKSHFASMPHEELPGFLAILRASDWTIGRAALQFLILTAARSGEVRGMTWREIDGTEWKIPGERMKAGKVHIVPLVPAAVALLDQMRGLLPTKPDDLVFPGLKGEMSDATLAKVMRTAGGGAYTVHGFRSTFRDWAADNGFTDSWAENALAHSNPDKTEAAYRRTSFFVQRRDKLMPAWAAYALGDQTNVVTLASARA
ncbi:tyrosine-type recombinase/integrase [Sphingomonas sp. KRR8]|nr:tyrosine-type recombinase/integrase [Sphingomonas sp. KRR8]